MFAETEVEYKRFFELSIDMLCIVTVEGYFIRLNTSFYEGLGHSKEALLSLPFADFIHPDDVEKTDKEIKYLAAGGHVSRNFENRYRHKDGHYLALSWSAQFDPESGFIFAVARDITEQKNETIKLAQIEKALRIESILAETDRRGMIIDVNDKFCEISGYSEQELIGETHKTINSGFHPHSFFVALWKTISNKESWSGIIKNKKKNGEFYYVHTIIIPISNFEGHVQSYLAIRQDITESIRHETDLAKTLEILNEMSLIAKVGGWELDITTGEQTWTDETFRMLEFDKGSNQTPTLPECLKLFTPEHEILITEAVSRAIDFGEPYSLELEALTAKGNRLWVSTQGQANYENGEIVSLSGTIQDIDARKKAEINYNLERQKSIQNAKLSSLGELAASMAHEINNPLGIISGYAELVLGAADISDDLSSKMTAISKSCGRISHIVNNLKKFSRVDSSENRSELFLSGIINEAISLAKPRLKRERVKLQFSDASDVKILCNAIEIEQVILNLINNSIDAVSGQSEKWIIISLQQNNDVIECHVVDSGLGIAEDAGKKVFSPFYTSKKAGEGTGLGLSIVAGILHDHNASIKYDSESSSTRFVMTFPKVKAT